MSGTTMCLICANNLQPSDALVARQIIALGRVWSMQRSAVGGGGGGIAGWRSSILRHCQWLHSVVIIVVGVAATATAAAASGLHFKLLSIYTSLTLNYPYTKCSSNGRRGGGESGRGRPVTQRT